MYNCFPQSRLSTEEITDIENKFGIIFPQSYKKLLLAGVGKDVVIDWKKLSEETIFDYLNFPIENIVIDIRYNNFWMEEWGIKPSTQYECIVLARSKLLGYPKLIPIIANKYIPSGIESDSNFPIISVHQSDIIYYASNIHTFIESGYSFDKKDITYVQGWTEIIHKNNN